MSFISQRMSMRVNLQICVHFFFHFSVEPPRASPTSCSGDCVMYGRQHEVSLEILNRAKMLNIPAGGGGGNRHEPTGKSKNEIINLQDDVCSIDCLHLGPVYSL